MELKELERDSSRPRMGHCRKNMSRAGRLKNRDSGKKVGVGSWELKWKEQSWSETGLVLLKKLLKIVKYGGIWESRKVRWNEVWNERRNGMERVGREVGIGKIKSMETWKKKMRKYQENWKYGKFEK